MSKQEIKVNINSSSTHRGPEKSTTLNRRYVKRPTKILIEESPAIVEEASIEAPVETTPIENLPKISHINIEKPVENIEPVEEKPVREETPDLPPAPNPYQEALDKKKAERDRQMVAEISSQALKEAAIAKALAEMESEAKVKKAPKVDKKEDKVVKKVMLSEMSVGATGKKAEKIEKLNKKQAKKLAKKEAKATRHIKKHRAGRIILAFAASAACMIALAMLVKVNLPNISVSVAAAQTGVEAKYPSYTPRDFNLSGVYTDNESVIVEFVGPNDTGFTLSEEKTSWDSNALITNYIKGAFGKDYEAATESGVTIYISHSNAAWIKDGVLYKLNASAGTLTKRQIKSIVTSL